METWQRIPFFCTNILIVYNLIRQLEGMDEETETSH